MVMYAELKLLQMQQPWTLKIYSIGRLRGDR